jgi:hypothetical protein
MTDHLHAFVGHSFLEQDRVVVSQILGMLDDVKKLLPGFEWDHAEDAEAKGISAKVFERMDGKNLFIGICTARERSASLSAFNPAPWYVSRKALFVVPSHDVSIKASDWVIQEIGFALGRGLKVLMLVEEGVRPPGGLQGDLEWVPFARASPRDAFSRLADMLSNLTPDKRAYAESAPPTPPSSGAESKLGEAFDNEFLEPSLTWRTDDFVHGYQYAVFTNRLDAAARIAEAFRASALSTDDGAVSEFEAMRITTDAIKHKTEWQQPLEELAKEYPSQPAPLRHLGARYKSFGEFRKSADLFLRACELVTAPAEKIELFKSAALAFAEEGDKAGARSIAERIGALAVSLPDLEALAMAALAEVWKSLKVDDLFIACAERCLELAPSREQPRFALAYLYSERGRRADALFHYIQLLKAHDDPMAWNNLGVSAAELKLPARAIDAYHSAEGKGNSLATSNLAYAYLAAGFVDQAIRLCEEGLGRENPHPNLSDAHAAALRAREAEQAREEDLINKAAPNRKKWVELAIASVRPSVEGIPPQWTGPQAALQAALHGSQLEFEGQYTRPALGGLAGLMPLGSRAEEFSILFKLEMTGLAGIGTIEERPVKPPSSPSLLGDYYPSRHITCVMSPDGRAIRIFEDGTTETELRVAS